MYEKHPLAIPAAEAAEAAGAQDRFWQMHDLLFEYSPLLEPPNLVAMAASLELELERFGQSLMTHRYLPRIREDIDSGVDSGVRGTPTFFINGIRHDGGYTADALLEAIQGGAPAYGP